MKNRELFMAGAGVAVVLGVIWYVRQGFGSLADAAASLKRNLGDAASSVGEALNPASQSNVVNRATNAALSAAAGRQTSLGSLMADSMPSPAERAINRPGFWVNNRPSYLSNLTPMLDGEFGTVPYDVTGFVGNFPEDPNEPTIFYRNLRRRMN